MNAALRYPDPAGGIDFFDVDHTIVDGATGVQSIFTAIGMGVLPRRIVLTLPFLYWRFQHGGFNGDLNDRRMSWLAGIAPDQLLSLGRENFRRRTRPALFAAAVERIHALKARGRRIVFVTASFEHLVAPLAELLSVDAVIANALAVSNGRTTGALREPFVFGDQKLNLALGYAGEAGVSGASCSFYTDSIHDLPLLKAVGHPVAVNPDAALRKTAAREGWEIADFRTGGYWGG